MSASTWDKQAVDYAERHQDDVSLSCLRMAVEQIPKSETILDAGCGVGMAFPFLMRKTNRLHAVDFSQQSCHKAQDIASRLLKPFHDHSRQHIDVRVGDLLTQPFPTESFQAILCANALQHFKPADQHAVIRNLLRMLKPGGTIVVSVHHYSAWKAAKGWKKYGKPGQPGIDFIHRFSTYELERLLPGAEIRACGFPLLPGRAQDWVSKYFGVALAQHGQGYMLVARYVKRD